MNFESFINSLLESVGIMTPFHELRAKPWVLLLIAVPLWFIAKAGCVAKELVFRMTIAENVLRDTGVESLFNPLGVMVKYFLYFSILYAFVKYIQNNMNIVTDKVEIIRQFVVNPTGTTGRRGVLGRCMEQILEYPAFFLTMIYELQQVKSKTDLVSKITMISSILKLPQGIWESTVSKMFDRPAIEGTEEMLDDVLPMVAMGLTITKTEIGDVSVENFLVNVDRNQRACENIIRRMQPLMIKFGMIKDNAYDTILQIAKEVNELSESETWMKTVLKLNPNEFLQTNGSIRVSEIREKVTMLRNKLNTLQTKELRSDKVVTECQKHLASLEILLIEVKVLEVGNQTRVKPVGVTLQGEKQIGKSNLVAILSRKVCEYVRTKGGITFRNAEKWTTWSRQCRDEFDTGYTGQEITYVDDAFQQKDNKDHLMWFTFISNTAVGTNQADLKQKGLPYRSKLVFTTCNKLPDKSITIEEIEALHARFPHTICMRRNKNKMPKKGAISEDYNWVDFYYGPMHKAVAATGSNSTSTLKKMTMKEIVEIIGDDLIIQDNFYNSTIKQQAIEGEEQMVPAFQQFRNEFPEFDEAYQAPSRPYTVDSEMKMIRDVLDEETMYNGSIDPLVTNFDNVIIRSLDGHDVESREYGVEPLNILNHVRSNMLSYRAWNLINSMCLNKTETFEQWLTGYIEDSVEGIKEDSIFAKTKIRVTPFTGLELAAAKQLLKENKFVEMDEIPSTSSDTYENVYEQLKKFVNSELSLMETDIVDLALAKICLSQLRGKINRSTWLEVGDWVTALKHKISGLSFTDHMDLHPCSLDQFLVTLKDWQVVDDIRFKSIYKQKILFIKSSFNLYCWSPFITRGTRFVKVNARFRELVEQLDTGILFHELKHITSGIRWMQGQRVRMHDHSGQYAKKCFPQNGMPINERLHREWIQMVQDSTYRCHTLIGEEKINILWNLIRLKPQQQVENFSGYLEQLQASPPKTGTICKQVAEEIRAEVTESYRTFTDYYTKLTKDGMHTLLSMLSRIGIPINAYWNDILVDRAPAITAITVGAITSLAIIAIVKTFQYGIAGEEQSKGEKRAKQKKLATTKMQKLKFHQGKEQAEGDVLQQINKGNPEIQFEAIENLFDHIDDNMNLAILGMNLMRCKAEDKCAFYAAIEETYDFSFSEPQPPQWKKVVTGKEDGKRYINLELRGEDTEDNILDEIQHAIKVSHCLPYAEWIFESWFKKEGTENIQYFIRLSLLSAKTQGGIVDWTRAETKNIKDIEIQLNRGKPIDVKSVVIGAPQASTQAYDTMDVLVNKHLVKVHCLDCDSINNLAINGTQVYALASDKVLIVPAHAIRQHKWIRFSRATQTGHYGVAKIDERKVDFTRDIAVANILSRAEAEQKLCDLDKSISLTNISKENFYFPTITKYLLTADQSEVEWLNCTTLHHFGKNKTVGLGRTKTFQVDEFLCGDKYITKKLVACVQGLQSEVELSQRGDCGSPIVLASGKKAGRLIGFHSYLSPNQQTWYGAMLTVEDLGIIKGQEEHFDDPWAQLITKGLPTDLPNGPEVEFIGSLVRPSLPVTKDTLDHWHKSPFADQFEEQLAPGRLNPYDPYIEGELPRNKEGRKSLILGPNSEMAKTLPELDQGLIDWIVDQLVVEQAATFKANNLLTPVSDSIDDMLEYALNGHIDNSYVRGMEINKAAGLPWSLSGFPKKSDFIEIDEISGKRSFKANINGDALKNRVELKLQQAKIGNRILSLSSSKLKDQPIKIAQAKSGRTRVFHCIPVDLILFSGALYGPYKEAYTKAGLKCYHAVGIDPKSVGWQQLATYMTKHPNYFDADYKNYDKYLHRQIFKAVRKIQRRVIQEVCPDKWDTARACEELDAIDTYVVDYQTVYKTNRGNKSGSYTTTIDNCLANDIYGLYAWVKTTGHKSLWDYRQNVSSVAFGDDIIKSVSEEYKDKYNYCTYRDVLNATGHIMTPGSKDGEEIPFTLFENLQFLKRGFKMQPGMVLAPLLKRSIEGPFVWTDIREDQTTVWVNLIQEQLIEAALWGEEYYNELCQKLKCGTNRTLNEVLAVLLNTSWKVTFQKFCDRYYGLKGGNI
ncbi:VP2 [Drosophila subobscura Nora virus]|uniref:VP2 n=1 Tax=Drosophila subobscura Nora virus TaxID=1500865 RepID=UPI0004D157FB|nr:VP2 [Drosophila subobscura Nora virus]AHZ92149.1 VP2 [Drosophila subobscura Nora virus]